MTPIKPMPHASMAAATFALLYFSVAASPAAVITTTYKGNISSQYDPDGIFVPIGTDLVGQQYTLTYITDESVTTPTYEQYANGVLTESALDGTITAQMTVGAYSASSVGNYGGTLQLSTVQNGPPTDGFDIATQSYQFDGTLRTIFSTEIDSHYPSPFPTGAYYSSFSYTTQPGDGAPSLFAIDHNGGTQVLNYNLSITSVTQSYTGTPLQIPHGPSVPEPATWAMMILGLGLVGASFRRRSASNSRNT